MNSKKLLKKRKSVKKFNPAHVISQEEAREIVALAQTAPSAWNLQHWRVIAVDDPALKAEIRTAGYGQAQLEEASMIFIILANVFAHEQLEEIYLPLLQEGLMHPPQYLKLQDNLGERRDITQPLREEAILNASLFAMQLILAAESFGHDTGPVGGFDHERVKTLFGLPDHLIPILLVAAGKAAEPAPLTTRLTTESILSFNR